MTQNLLDVLGDNASYTHQRTDCVVELAGLVVKFRDALQAHGMHETLIDALTEQFWTALLTRMVRGIASE